MLKLLIMLLVAYLLGSIPTGVWIGKIFFHTDIRKAGSGNIGTTNTYRVLGKTAGTVVMLIDILKGALSTLQPVVFGAPIVHGVVINGLLIGLGAILGNTFSIFDGFKGGKAVATSAGILAGYNFPFFIVACIIFGSLVYITSMVSVASMAALTIITFLSLLYQDGVLTTVAFVLTLFIIYRHRANLDRIKAGTENMVPFGLYRRYRLSHPIKPKDDTDDSKTVDIENDKADTNPESVKNEASTASKTPKATAKVTSEEAQSVNNTSTADAPSTEAK
ncbi:Acyl-phosphate [Furfurilactobacillus rossiae]|uniref:Glycerol-3-phosphate acyltransferase n=1 Tax=Furfurilactobacillus rossiae DSM 15814 TaxID=1114972 RepID=A0A0R1RM56_9LACO|nr:acyl-phosphate glycerol 3-phosphate acyltransferase [Furfurilactobacillus rossiae DSM 15814]QLE61316.1 Acyl-phosphate [Furfurilactobacillus rossiae]